MTMMTSLFRVIIARQHSTADARYWYGNSVCLSVCQSRSGNLFAI